MPTPVSFGPPAESLVRRSIFDQSAIFVTSRAITHQQRGKKASPVRLHHNKASDWPSFQRGEEPPVRAPCFGPMAKTDSDPMIDPMSADCARLLADAETELSSIRTAVAANSLESLEMLQPPVPAPHALRRAKRPPLPSRQ
jgi:hypothetical protein